MQSRIWHKGSLIIGVPLVLQMVMLAVLAYFLHEQEAQLELQTRSQDIETAATLVRSAAMGSWGNAVLYNGTGAPQFLQRRNELNEKMNKQYDFLFKTIKEPDKLALVKQMRSYQDFYDRMQVPLLDKNNLDLNLKEWLGNPEYAKDIHEKLIGGDKPIYKLVSIERKEAAKIPKRMQELSNNVTTVLAAGIIINLLVAILLALMVSRTISRRMVHLIDNTSRMRQQRALAAPQPGSDELAELDRYLYETGTEVIELDEYRKQIVGIVSHELRTPLSSVRGSLELLSAGVCGTLPEKVDKRLSVASQEVDRLMRLINNLLDIEKIEAGKLQIEKKTTAVSDLFAKAIRATQSAALDRQITIESVSTNIAVQVDEDRLIQVLVNLIANAIKYSPAGGKIMLSCEEQAESILISVSDNGKGISKENMDRVFERYQQVSETDASELGGLGLGLAICKSLVTMHGGRISVKSEEGAGSTFTIHLPKQ